MIQNLDVEFGGNKRDRADSLNILQAESVAGEGRGNKSKKYSKVSSKFL